MLLNYSVTNYGGFKDTATLSMVPGVEMQRYEDNEVDFGNDIKVLKSAVIVGENGGGKTTLARSMRTLQDLVSASNKVLKAQYGTVNANLQHLYPAASQKYELEAVIEINGEIYVYHFLLELDGEGIVQEFLFRRKLCLICCCRQELDISSKLSPPGCYFKLCQTLVISSSSSNTSNKIFTFSDSSSERFTYVSGTIPISEDIILYLLSLK